MLSEQKRFSAVYNEMCPPPLSGESFFQYFFKTVLQSVLGRGEGYLRMNGVSALSRHQKPFRASAHAMRL